MCILEFCSVRPLIVVIVIFQCDYEHNVCSKAYNLTNLSLKHERFIWYNTSIHTLKSLAFGNVGEPSRFSGGNPQSQICTWMFYFPLLGMSL